MSFFERPPGTSAGVAWAKVVSPPPWAGPPHNTLPGVAPTELLIARTDDTAVAVVGIRAYPTGFAFTLSLRVRHLSIREQQQFPYLLDHGPFEDDPMPDEFLRFGVQFADGRKATNLHWPAFGHEEREPDPPVLAQGGGGGGGQFWDEERWVWPLPPAGPLAFVCEWPARGIAETRTETDARLILEAAGRAVTLWPED